MTNMLHRRRQTRELHRASDAPTNILIFRCKLSALLSLMVHNNLLGRFNVRAAVELRVTWNNTWRTMILYRVPEIVTRGRFPDGGESDSTWRTQEARHVGSDTIAPGF